MKMNDCEIYEEQEFLKNYRSCNAVAKEAPATALDFTKVTELDLIPNTRMSDIFEDIFTRKRQGGWHA